MDFFFVGLSILFLIVVAYYSLKKKISTANISEVNQTKAFENDNNKLLLEIYKTQNTVVNQLNLLEKHVQEQENRIGEMNRNREFIHMFDKELVNHAINSSDFRTTNLVEFPLFKNLELSEHNSLNSSLDFSINEGTEINGMDNKRSSSNKSSRRKDSNAAVFNATH